jgi:CIC family chloride channel protein
MVLAALALVRNFAPEAAGSGVQEIEGAMIGLRKLRWRRVLPVKFVAGILSIGSGLVLGREGPTIHIGASVSAAIADLRRFPMVETRGLYAAGAAAGLAAAFNAPLAAVLFVVEETRQQFPYTFRTYLAVILASFCSTVVTQQIAGVGPDLRIAASEPGAGALPQFLILGVVLGGFGVVFNRTLLWSLDRFQAVGRRAPYLLPAMVAAVIGALLVVMPDATRGGETLILHLVDEHRTMLGLLSLVARAGIFHVRSENRNKGLA